MELGRSGGDHGKFEHIGLHTKGQMLTAITKKANLGQEEFLIFQERQEIQIFIQVVLRFKTLARLITAEYRGIRVTGSLCAAPAFGETESPCQFRMTGLFLK